MNNVGYILHSEHRLISDTEKKLVECISTTNTVNSWATVGINWRHNTLEFNFKYYFRIWSSKWTLKIEAQSSLLHEKYL